MCAGARTLSGSAPWQTQAPGKFLPVIARSEATGQSVLLAVARNEKQHLGRIRKALRIRPRQHTLAHADTCQISACHCEERSDAAIRSPCGSAKQKATIPGECEKHCEFALSTTDLPGFSARTRIATPVCALVRNDMQKEGRVRGCKNVARNDMLKEDACQRLQGRLARWNAKDGGAPAYTRTFPAVLRQCPLANADTRQISACHCEERSDVAIRSPRGSAKQKATIPGEYEKHCEFALSTTDLPGFSARTRIATPVCALVRNDMQKEGRVRGCKNVARNDMLKEDACQRLQGPFPAETCGLCPA